MKQLLAKAKTFYEKDRYQDALVIAKKVLVVDKNNDSALFYVAHGLYYARKFRQSLRFWKRLEIISPNEPNLHLNMGACYDDLGQSALAIKNFKRELELDPVNGKALYNLGSLYYRSRKPKLAVNYLERCYSQKHSVEATVAKLAWCYFKTGQLEKEQILYEGWLKANPNDTWALNNLGSHLMGQGEYHRAMLRLKKAAQLAPSDRLVAKNIRKAKRMLKKLEEN